MEFYTALLFSSFISLCLSFYSTEICGTHFSDHFSSSMRADLVVEAKLSDSLQALNTAAEYPLYSAKFEILNVIKSNPSLWESTNILIEPFYETENNTHKCIYGNLQKNVSYILFLKDVFGEAYELSAFPIHSNARVMKEITDFLNSSNDMLEAPRVNATNSIVNGDFNKNLSIECTSSGFPAPLFRWWYRNRLATVKRFYYITSDKNSSRLTLMNATHNLHGLYKCEAYNIMGSSNASVRVNVQLYNITIRADHTIRCPSYLDHGHCFHNATCFLIVYSETRTCRCTIGYVGHRCETYFDYDSAKDKSVIRRLFSGDIQLPMMILVPVIIAMLFIAILIALFIVIKKHYKRRNYVKATQNQEYS